MAAGGRKVGGKTDLTTAERTRRAVELRASGMELEQIAAELGYANASGPYKAIMRALQATLHEPADELRTLELKRLDIALAALWPQIVAGKGWAIDRMLAIMDRRAKLLGLDAPLKREDKQTIEIRVAAERVAARTGVTVEEVISHAERLMQESTA